METASRKFQSRRGFGGYEDHGQRGDCSLDVVEALGRLAVQNDAERWRRPKTADLNDNDGLPVWIWCPWADLLRLSCHGGVVHLCCKICVAHSAIRLSVRFSGMVKDALEAGARCRFGIPQSGSAKDVWGDFERNVQVPFTHRLRCSNAACRINLTASAVLSAQRPSGILPA